MTRTPHVIVLTLTLCLLAVYANARQVTASGLHFRTTSDSTVALVSSADHQALSSIVIPAQIHPESDDPADAPLTVTAIDTEALAGCTSLTTLTLPATIDSIGHRAFIGCTSLRQVNTPSLEAWCRIRFADMFSNPATQAHSLSVQGTELTTLALPQSVAQIQPYAFRSIATITEAALGSGITSIGECAFEDCTSLSQAVLPSSLTVIGPEAFAGCTALQRISLPPGLESICRYAFRGCTALVEASLPTTLTNLGEGAFMDCTSLVSAHIQGPVKSLQPSTFQGCTALVSLRLDDTVTSLHNYTLCSAQSLPMLALTDSVQHIWAYAAKECRAMRTLWLGENIRKVGNEAFMDCNALTSVTSMAQTPPAGAPDAFAATVYASTPLLVPEGTESAYASHELWGNFATIRPIPESLDIVVSDCYEASYTLTPLPPGAITLSLSSDLYPEQILLDGTDIKGTITPDNTMTIHPAADTELSIDWPQSQPSPAPRTATDSTPTQGLTIASTTATGALTWPMATIADANLRIEPTEGYTIQSAKLDGTDITSLIPDNSTIPVATIAPHGGRLELTYQLKTISATKPIDFITSAPTVITGQGYAVITGLAQGTPLQISATDARSILHTQADGPSHIVTLPAGIYILSAEGHNIKFAVK